MKSTNNFFPTAEELGKDEMRISFLGSVTYPVSRIQAGTCILVELGNGKEFLESCCWRVREIEQNVYGD